MNQNISQQLLWLIFVLVFPLYLTGCASSGPTKPNLPYTGNPYPAELTELARKSPLLVQELGKLPELQGGVSETDVNVLKGIVKLYNSDPVNFEKVFNEMYKVGLPEFRKYCSPLQAVYWLIENGKIDSINIHNYDLFNLLNNAWWSTLFEYNDPKGKWKKFSDVAERLNSPILLDYYERRDFSYVTFEKTGYKLEHGGPPQNVIFKKKKGSCSFFTSFSAHCLHIAGYQGKAIAVKYNDGGNNFHHVCEFVDKDGKFYIMDNSRKVSPAGSGIFTKDSFFKEYTFVMYGYYRFKQF